MKITNILYKQHVTFHFRKNWQVQGKRIPVQTRVEELLNKKGIACVDALDVIKEPKHPTVSLDIIGPVPQPLPLNEKHPDYKSRKCLTMGPYHLLLEGADQARILTKSVSFAEGLPKNITSSVENTDVPNSVHNQVKKIILSANMFDSEQLRLPKIYDSERPAVNFTRLYGITDKRRNILTTSKILNVIERNASLDLTLERRFTEDVDTTVMLEKDGDLLRFDQHINTLVSSLRALPPIVDAASTEKERIVDLHPIRHTVTLEEKNIYKEENFYPINLKHARVYHPHTLFLHFNETECTNLYELPVREKQICGRTLIHAFTVAAAYAKQRYGETVKALPAPVTLQCVQSDGRLFHFGVLQLNTLDLDGSKGVKNVWWSIPRIPLFEECKYKVGLPILTEYNLKVYKYLNAFYNNQ